MTTRTHVFVDIFTKTSKFCETVFVSKFGAQVELFDRHWDGKSRDTLPFRELTDTNKYSIFHLYVFFPSGLHIPSIINNQSLQRSNERTDLIVSLPPAESQQLYIHYINYNTV